MMGKIRAYILEHWISFLALGVSVFLLWRDYLQPFNLTSHPAGRITVARNPFSESLHEDCILLDLVFENHGARGGAVEDVALVVRAPDAVGIFRSLAVQNDRTLNLTRELPPPALETFVSFHLAKQESAVRRVLFVPRSGDGFVRFIPGRYALEIWVRASGIDDWKRTAQSTFTYDGDDATALDRTSAAPDAKGGQFVEWMTRDKVLDESEQQLRNLADQVGAGTTSN
jgi:hypothetical protein